MTNVVAFWLGAAILAAVAADLALNGGAVLFFLALKFTDVLDWAAFWR